MNRGPLTPRLVRNLINRIGENNVWRLLECPDITVAFDTVSHHAVIKAVHPVLKIFETIELGRFPFSGSDFCQTLKGEGFRIDDYARDMLSQTAFTVTQQVRRVDVVVMSVSELGFAKGASYQRICASAHELGLQLCPAEVAPRLRLQYRDQPAGSWLIIAMNPITGTSGRSYVFSLGHCTRGLWLACIGYDPDHFWQADAQFSFCFNKQSLAA